MRFRSMRFGDDGSAFRYWRKRFLTLAASEGWSIEVLRTKDAPPLYVVFRAPCGPGEKPLLPNGETAWKIVLEGSQRHHEFARRLLADYSPISLDTMIEEAPVDGAKVAPDLRARVVKARLLR